MAILDVARDENLTIISLKQQTKFQEDAFKSGQSCKPKAKVNFVFDADHPIVSACVTPQ